MSHIYFYFFSTPPPPKWCFAIYYTLKIYIICLCVCFIWFGCLCYFLICNCICFILITEKCYCLVFVLHYCLVFNTQFPKSLPIQYVHHRNSVPWTYPTYKYHNSHPIFTHRTPIHPTLYSADRTFFSAISLSRSHARSVRRSCFSLYCFLSFSLFSAAVLGSVLINTTLTAKAKIDLGESIEPYKHTHTRTRNPKTNILISLYTLYIILTHTHTLTHSKNRTQKSSGCYNTV